jgi:hypothetical protein
MLSGHRSAGDGGCRSRPSRKHNTSKPTGEMCTSQQTLCHGGRRCWRARCPMTRRPDANALAVGARRDGTRWRCRLPPDVDPSFRVPRTFMSAAPWHRENRFLGPCPLGACCCPAAMLPRFMFRLAARPQPPPPTALSNPSCQLSTCLPSCSSAPTTTLGSSHIPCTRGSV